MTKPLRQNIPTRVAASRRKANTDGTADEGLISMCLKGNNGSRHKVDRHEQAAKPPDDLHHSCASVAHKISGVSRTTSMCDWKTIDTTDCDLPERDVPEQWIPEA